jgi:monofunctional glycosyltransferase
MSEFRQTDGDGLWRNSQETTVKPAPRTATAVPPRAVPPPSQSVEPATMQADTRPASHGRSFLRLIKRGVRFILLAAAIVTAVVATLVVTYRFVNPPISTLMLIQRAGGETITRTWVPLEKISPHLVRAVIMSEDASFCRHLGVDWRELEAAFERSADGIPRGGSTISMQTAKNLFLWPSKSYVRKAIEIPLTIGMEVVWPKTRMLEIYLNIVEWGPGVFGADAAARYHFNKPASRLTEAEAALLAVTLPAPLIRNPGNPSTLLAKMGQTIQGRMRAVTRHASCILPSTTAAR